MPIVVFELASLVFVPIEVLIFALPARAPNAPDSGHIVRPDLEVRAPGIVVTLRPCAVVRPDLHHRPHRRRAASKGTAWAIRYV
jgi:hypothetical protein